MIIVTLVASLAAGMAWQQYAPYRPKLPTAPALRAAGSRKVRLDWARLILLEDAKGRPPATQRPPRRGLGSPAGRIAPVHFPRCRPHRQQRRRPEAFLSGSIVDLQARCNLRALLGGEKVNPVERQTLERLASRPSSPPPWLA